MEIVLVSPFSMPSLGQVAIITRTSVAFSSADLYPKLTSMPQLQKPEVTATKEVRFPCRIDYPIGQPDVAFIVTWMVDGHELYDPVTKTPIKTVLTGDSRIAYLDAMKLQNNLGKEVF